MTKNKPVKKTETTLLDQYIKQFRQISTMHEFSGKVLWDQISKHIDSLEAGPKLLDNLKKLQQICDDKIKAIKDLGESINSSFDKSLEGWAILKDTIKQYEKGLQEKLEAKHKPEIQANAGISEGPNTTSYNKPKLLGLSDKELIALAENFEASTYFPKKSSRQSSPEYINRPSLEEMHELFYSVKELEKSQPQLYNQNKKILDAFKTEITDYCNYEYKNKSSKQEKSNNTPIVIGNSLGKDEKLKGLINLISKDPEMVAKKLLMAKGSTSGSNLESEKVLEVILQNCSPEQTYRIAKIGEEIQKREGNKKRSFKENLKGFCKAVAGIFNSKYKVSDKELEAAFTSIRNLENTTKDVAGKTFADNNEAKKEILGKFTEVFAKASSQPKDRGFSKS
ncbi:MAG: hypothetical protein K0Q51_651 [Rickettsiaceae bacterium]|jgi:hypothetical protein|nr:hypothetical protein [Rickettsiaceae bacterium]